MIAVVTGAGRGIGRAVSIELARRGADVALLSLHVPNEAADEVRKIGKRALSIECDVADAKAVANAAKKVLGELGPPDVIVANAGIVRRALVTEMDEADWDAVVDVSLKGTFLTARAFVPSLVSKKKGRFVAIGSISSTLGTARQSAYCAAKWGTVGFVKSLAEEVRGSGVQAMCVLPGSVDTDMLKQTPFAPAMGPGEVARVVTWCAGEAPDAMTGANLEVFG